VALARDSVMNVSQLLTLDCSFSIELAGILPSRLQHSMDDGLRMVPASLGDPFCQNGLVSRAFLFLT
jgi:hypothetical protein